MRTWVRTSAKTAVLTAGFVALGAGVTFADSHPTTTGNGSALSGNQLVGNLDVPVNVSGNAVGGVLGVAGAASHGDGAAVVDSGGSGPHTSGNGSLLSGNQAVLDGDVPVNVSGNAVGAVLGTAGAASHGSGSAVVEGDGGHHHRGDTVSSSGNGALASANQIVADLDVPVNASGNAVGAVAGVAGAAANDTGALVAEGGHHGKGHGKGHGSDGYHRHQAAPAEGGGLLEWANLGRPLHLSPNAVDAGPVVHQRAGDGGDDIMTSGNGSALSGNQLVGDLDVPVNASGNAIAAVGGVAGAASHDTGAVVVDKGDDDIMTSGNGALLSGNQAVLDGDVPVNVSGNAVGAVLGTAGAASHGDGAAVIEGAGGDVRHTADETVPQAAGTLPETSEVADRAAEELPLRNELPDPSGVLPLNAEVPGTEAIESQVPSEVPAPTEAAPEELSGLAEATEQGSGAVGGIEDQVGDLGL
ncbi:hypothetical protein LP52_18650 [Streptomonospora alba]|uniref:Chaplin domain-containing protein n=1 Tax=Streptomonospora alba TaxID=183763 RepID=A0A0C2FEC7_9ACTN|nr:hypothetical protein [Streptomonospora alba]KIH97554.1 hypothetical protein LP52_18650 [Streptomonospora alba]